MAKTAMARRNCRSNRFGRVRPTSTNAVIAAKQIVTVTMQRSKGSKLMPTASRGQGARKRLDVLPQFTKHRAPLSLRRLGTYVSRMTDACDVTKKVIGA